MITGIRIPSLPTSRIISPHFVYQWLTAVVVPCVSLQFLQVLFAGPEHDMVNKLAWHIVIDVVGLIITLAKALNSIRLRKSCALPGWFNLVWVGCIVGDQTASITLIVLMWKQNHLNFGAWASTTSILFIMFEEALVLLQVCHKAIRGTDEFTMTPPIRSLATLLVAELCGFVFVLGGQFSHHGMLSTGLVMAGCAIFSGLNAAAVFILQKRARNIRSSTVGVKVDYLRIVLPQGVIIGGNLFALLCHEWITHMLVFVTTMEAARLIDVIWHQSPLISSKMRQYVLSDARPQPHQAKLFVRSHDGRTASSEEQLIIDDFNKTPITAPTPSATMIRKENDATSHIRKMPTIITR